MSWKTVIVSITIYVAITTAACPNYCVCEHQTIDCSSRQLNALPQDLPIQVLSQENAGGPIKTDTGLLYTSLNLAHNQLEGLPETLLSDRLPHLRRLDLSNNNILEIAHMQSIVLSKELLHLKLSNNPIRSLGFNSDTILYSQSISYLDISYCAINSVVNSLSFTYMLNLTYLDLSGNPLVVVDHLSSGTISHLDLSHCLLTDKSIREEAFTNLPNLKSLNLSTNAQLTKFPSSKTLSSSIVHLDASYCAFEKLDLRSFPNLQYVNLKGNIIKVLQDYLLSDNPNIESLDLSENSVHVVEQSAFASCNSLRKLDLSVNLVLNLNWSVFSQCLQLITLNVSRNLLTSLEEIPITSLITLDASKCDIFRLSPRFLTKALNIKYLNLSRNSIEKLPKRMISRSLLSLDLSYCRVSDLQYETFQELSSLTYLNLMGNRLTIPAKGNLHEQLMTMKELNIANNPWHCDCNDPELKKYWKYSSIYLSSTEYFKSLICHSPKEFTGISLEKNCFENYTSNMHVVTKSGPWLSFLVPFLTLCCLLAIVVVIRQAYTSHALELQERELANQRSSGSPRSRRVSAHFFDEDLERGIQMSVNESLQRSPIRQLSKLPSYEEALLLPKPQSREDLQKIVKNYEEHGRFGRPSANSTETPQPQSLQCEENSSEFPSTSGQ